MDFTEIFLKVFLLFELTPYNMLSLLVLIQAKYMQRQFSLFVCHVLIGNRNWFLEMVIGFEPYFDAKSIPLRFAIL